MNETIRQFVRALNTTKSDENAILSLTISEVSEILSLLKAHEVFMDSLNECVDISLKKIEKESHKDDIVCVVSK